MLEFYGIALIVVIGVLLYTIDRNIQTNRKNVENLNERLKKLESSE